jgi:hypothetical protein
VLASRFGSSGSVAPLIGTGRRSIRGMEDSNAVNRLATQARSVAHNLEGCAAAISSGAPAFALALRMSSVIAAVADIGEQAYSGQGLLFAPGQVASPDIPVYLRANVEVQAAPAVALPVPSDAELDAYNTALNVLASEWPGLLQNAAAALVGPVAR